MRMNNVFKGFGHLCLTVNDVDVSLAFYHGLLGLISSCAGKRKCRAWAC